MSTEEQIEEYLLSQPEPKQSGMRALHELARQTSPGCRLWITDGRNEEGKVVANPSIGYGAYTIRYADGTTREFYRIGLSGNTAGISVYVMGLEDKTYLPRTYGETIGKASVTGYCIKFRALKDIDVKVLGSAMRDGFEAQ